MTTMLAEEPPTLRVQSCLGCGAPMQLDEARLFQKRCDACEAVFERVKLEEEQRAWLRRREIEWKDLLALHDARSFSEHQHYWLTKLGPKVKDAADRWCRGAMKELSHGLGLVGLPGVGKTVAAGRCLYRAHRHGHSVAITTDPRIAQLASVLSRGTNEDKVLALAEVDALRKADVLLIDDIGQQATAGAGRDLLFRIVHERHYAGRCLLWTAQSDPNWIAARLGAEVDEQGRAHPTEELAAFVRRISSPFVKMELVDEPQQQQQRRETVV